MCIYNVYIYLMSVPKIVFIVPYRNREKDLEEFRNQMTMILEDYSANTYKILFIHQCDDRAFNRGGMKNIGFLFVKNTYPNDYQNITLVFNDVDTFPRKKNTLQYETTDGNVKHFYGFKYALGGIVSIKAKDFEKINGFPNFWAWGYEDNELQNRVLKNGLTIDRNQFFLLKDEKTNENIIRIPESTVRIVNEIEYKKYLSNINDGIQSIGELEYNYDARAGFVNVSNFTLPHTHVTMFDKQFDLRQSLSPFSRGRKDPIMNMLYMGKN